MEVDLSGNRSLKILLSSLISLIFLVTFSLMGACKADEPADTTAQAETADEEVTGESMEDDEKEDMEEDEVEEAVDAEETADPEEEEEEEMAAGYVDITAAEAKELIDNNPDLIIIDVSPKYDEGHLPGAVNYYLGDGSLDAAIPDLDPEAMYLVYCHVDSVSISGAQKLVDAGFMNVYRLEGNYASWVDAGYDVEIGSGGDAAMMSISSPAFENNSDIPEKYSCKGTDVSPELVFEGVPSDAVSLVLIVDDPDAPVGTWVHWTVWNIDPSTTSIPENSVPAGSVEGTTDFNIPGYGGPCPPSGTHRYFFKLYALDTTLDLDSSARVPDIEAAMDGHILASAELIGLFSN
jgi:Raf kinase inhibitor-like YbhB/YbcL family protein